MPRYSKSLIYWKNTFIKHTSSLHKNRKVIFSLLWEGIWGVSEYFLSCVKRRAIFVLSTMFLNWMKNRSAANKSPFSFKVIDQILLPLIYMNVQWIWKTMEATLSWKRKDILIHSEKRSFTGLPSLGVVTRASLRRLSIYEVFLSDKPYAGHSKS